MRVIRARTAGFCMGVSLALQKLENAILRQHGQICTLGPIIHNPQALADFEARGVKCLASAEQANADSHVLIRAHGIPRHEELRLRGCGASVEDATCPRVKKAQLAIARATRNGATLLLFGEAEHPEVAGLVSYTCGLAHVFASPDELRLEQIDAAKGVVLASQTTQDRQIFRRIAGQAGEYFPELVVLNTICDATRERQAEALAIAEKVDVMVVVGGRQSGNTRRLADLAREAGIDTWLVETCAELEPESFAGKKVAGLTAGASTPKKLIDEAEEWLGRLNISSRGR